MRIHLVSYPAIMMTKGGPTYKVIPLMRELKKLGVDAGLFDMWDQNKQYGKEDLFHIFNASISTYSVFSVLNKLELKYVVNPIFYSNRSPLAIRTYMRLENLKNIAFRRSYSDYSLSAEICRHAARVLPNTQAEGDMLHKGLGVDKDTIQVIANGVEDRFYHADPELFKQKFGLENFILYVGHLGPDRKNGRRILEALNSIDHPSVVIADIIETKEGKWCREFLRNNHKIRFLNWLDHDDPLLASAYAASKTFILPTKFETPGRAALEAGLAGANIVITARGGAAEYFRGHAIYPDPLSIRSIAAAIETSLEQPKKNTLKEHIKNHYTWDRIAVETLEVYRNVMGGSCTHT